MMDLSTLDLEKELGIRKSKLRPHDLRDFFYSRKVLNIKIAKVLGVSTVLVGYWMNGNFIPPEKRENDLQALADKIREWEREHGKVFNSDKQLRQSIKK